MKSYIYMIFCFLFTNTIWVEAQVELIFGDSTVNEKAIATYPMPDGSLWILGFTNSGPNGGADATLLRIDSLGNTVTPTIYFGDSDNNYPNNMMYKSGRLIIVGETHSPSGVDGFVLVVDTAGNFEDFQNYGQANESEQFYDAKLTQDGGFIVTGFGSNSSVGASNDVLIAKFDYKRQLDWLKTQNLGTNEIGVGVVEHPQGGYLIAGDQLQSSGNYNVVLLRCDPLGNYLWDTVITNPYNGGCKQMILKDNQFIIVGEMSTATSSAFDAYMIRVDLQGNVLWQGTFPKTNNGDALFDVYAPSLNAIYVTGYSYNSNNQSTDLIIMKVDSMGVILEERLYGGTAFDMGLDIQVKANGRFVLSGFTNRQSDNQYYVIYDSFTPFTSVIKVENDEKNKKRLYPNPVENWLSISEEIQYDQIRVMDLTGKEYTVKTNEQQIDLRNLSSGLYWFVFYNKGKQTHRQQVLKTL